MEPARRASLRAGDSRPAGFRSLCPEGLVEGVGDDQDHPGDLVGGIEGHFPSQ
jgi:hypothetical protein